MDFNNALSKLLGNDKSIDEVQIDQRVIDEIIKIAINADPKEYVALLSGKIDKHILKITGLIFLPYKASESSAVMQVFMMPMTTKAVGSVHSHPGPSAQPSQADLTFFQKNGYFHMIICRPYSEASIRAYDHAGNPLTFVIKDLGEEVEIKQWDELDIDKEYFDEEFIEEMKKLEQEEDEILHEEKSVQEEIIQKKDTEVESNNIAKENNIMSQQDNNQPKKQATLNLEFEIKGKKVTKEIPLPPEYEPGDQIDVDIRTDKTPNDDIDEILVHVRKAPQNVNNNNQNRANVRRVQIPRSGASKNITTTNMPNNSANNANDDVIDITPQKSSEEIEEEIKQMEEDIAKLKAENERLKNNL